MWIKIYITTFFRENSTTKNTHQDMCNSTFTCINDAGKNLQAAYFAVPALLLFLMLIGNIVLWKSKHIRKRICCLGTCAALFISSISGSGGGCPGCCQRVFGNDKNWSPRLFKSEEGQTPDSPFTYFNASLQMYLSIITIDNPNVYSILSCNPISNIYKRQFSEDIR